MKKKIFVPIFAFFTQVHCFAHMDLNHQILKLSQQIENDNNPMLLVYRAEMHRKHNDLQEALKDLGKIPSSSSRNVIIEAQIIRAQILHDQNDYLKSQKLLLTLLSQPMNAKLQSKALQLQAVNYRALKQAEKSLESFEKSLQIDPSPNPDIALEILKDSYNSHLSSEWRIHFIESALEKFGFVAALFDELLKIHKAENAPRSGLALIQKWETSFPNPLFLNLEKANFLIQLDDKIQAKEVLESLIRDFKNLSPLVQNKESFKALYEQANAKREQL